MQSMLGVGLCLVCGPLALAAEASAEAKQELRVLYDQLRQHDLWTTLMWEQWALKQKLRFTAQVSGSVDVLGDTTFAAPEDIHFIKDRGTEVEMVTNHRWYRYAGDGHPDEVPVPLPFDRVTSAAFSHTPGYIAVMTFKRGDVNLTWAQKIISVPKGEVMLETGAAEPDGETFDWDDPLQVSDDGSAVAATFYLDNKTVVVTSAAGADRVAHPGMHAALGVGPKASWVLGSVVRAGEWSFVLESEGNKIPLKGAACGPGIAVVVTNDSKPKLVGRDGKLSDLVLPISIGDRPHLASVGRYLVVNSGANGFSRDNTDFFGAPLANPPPQPILTACIPWEQVAAGKCDSAVIQSGQFSINENGIDSIYVWKDEQGRLIDLSGPVPKIHDLYTAPARITWIGSAHYWALVQYVEGQAALIDDQGRELWSGAGYPDVQTQDYAVVSQGEDTSKVNLVHLSTDPKLRSSRQLVVPGEGEWTFEVDGIREQVLAKNGVDWAGFDLQGVSTHRLGSRGIYPQVWHALLPPGRFCIWGGRLLPKDGPFPDAESRFCPEDAWISTENEHPEVTAVDRDEHVLIYLDVKKGKVTTTRWFDLGHFANASHLATVGRNPEVDIVDGRNMQLAHVVNDRLMPIMNPIKAQDLPPGTWRVDNAGNFSPSGWNTMTWSDDLAGFRPIRMRSPTVGDTTPLVVVSASLVLLMGKDKDVLDMVTKPKR